MEIKSVPLGNKLIAIELGVFDQCSTNFRRRVPHNTYIDIVSDEGKMLWLISSSATHSAKHSPDRMNTWHECIALSKQNMAWICSTFRTKHGMNVLHFLNKT